ncbi:hypothetical protein BaRGS_00014935 [Batillaria attramentaria]|uniref:Uncharacterized protein n=1 Tax=Batillaria attramentaria TaxID=370345 RepID=A0ABD0L3S9_9CAEN
MVLKQLRYRNSFPIKRGTLPVSENAFCACKAASATGTNWECKGRLVSAWEKDRKVVVTRREGLTLAECDCEFSKREFAEDVIGSSAERLRRCVQLVPMFCAQFSGQGEAETDECVLIRDRVEGAEQELLRVWEGGSRNPHPHPIILSLAKASCRHSRGQAVISSVKGVMKTSHDNEQCHVTYHVTSLAVQSVKKEYGASDRGVQGVTAFLEWAGLESSSSNTGATLEPTAPPPEYEAVVGHASSDDSEQYTSMTSCRKCTSSWDNRCQPSAPELSEDDSDSDSDDSFGEHVPCRGNAFQTEAPESGDISEEQVIQWLQNHDVSNVERLLELIHGPPPAYCER